MCFITMLSCLILFRHNQFESLYCNCINFYEKNYHKKIIINWHELMNYILIYIIINLIYKLNRNVNSTRFRIIIRNITTFIYFIIQLNTDIKWWSIFQRRLERAVHHKMFRVRIPSRGWRSLGGSPE